MRIELADKNQATSIIELLRELYLELGEEEESIQFLNPKFIEEILNSNLTDIYLVYNHNQEAIGIITLTQAQSIYAGGKYGLLDEMYVKPGYRSKNIGSQIIQNIKEIALAKQWKRIDVTAPTEERWKRTVEFYEKNGFVFTGPKLKFKLD